MRRICKKARVSCIEAQRSWLDWCVEDGNEKSSKVMVNGRPLGRHPGRRAILTRPLMSFPSDPIVQSDDILWFDWGVLGTPDAAPIRMQLQEVYHDRP
jgi:hypothetical protein